MPQILVAEDEAMLRVIAVEMLEDAGFTVFQAGDGEEALSLLKANPEIVLLVSDVKMPRMDGYALVQAGRDFKPDLKVLMMTGYAEQRERASGLDAIVRAVIAKPFTLAEIRFAVAAAIAAGDR